MSLDDDPSMMMHVSTSHKTRSYAEMSSGFPSDVLQLLCLSAAFYLAKWNKGWISERSSGGQLESQDLTIITESNATAASEDP